MKNYIAILILQVFLFQCLFAPPITNKKKEDFDDLIKLFKDIDYSKYLTQVMQELHSDPEFVKRVDKDDVADPQIIADSLHVASNKVRSKLDELKRIEVLRLTKLQKELDHRNNQEHQDPLEMPSPVKEKVDLDHVNYDDPGSFSSEDLKRLISKTSNYLSTMDKYNDNEYKKHEMEKEAQHMSEMNKIKDKKIREEQEKKWKEGEQYKRSHHDAIPEPGSLDHLMDVWKNDDHMEDQTFNPRVFFLSHDINQDGYLDHWELEALLQTELDKAYPPDSNETDYIERNHEMNRMRNQFMKHVDKDGNQMVSLEEFLDWTKKGDFKKSEVWKTQEEQDKPYNEDEFNEFFKQFQDTHSDIPPVPVTDHGQNMPETPKQHVPIHA